MTAGLSDGAALLIVDMLNDLEFDGGDQLRAPALRAAAAIADLARAARAAGVPIIYANDNHDDWRAGRGDLIARATRDGTRGAEMAELLRPLDDDYLVVKPRFSAFYATNLPVLLPELGVSRLILTGVATDICVLFTAADAHMREYRLWVPSNAVASEQLERSQWALDIIKNSMDAEVRPTTELNLIRWLGSPC